MLGTMRRYSCENAIFEVQASGSTNYRYIYIANHYVGIDSVIVGDGGDGRLDGGAVTPSLFYSRLRNDFILYNIGIRRHVLDILRKSNICELLQCLQCLYTHTHYVLFLDTHTNTKVMANKRCFSLVFTQAP